MKKTPVISLMSLQSGIPLFKTVMAWMFLDYVGADKWVWVASGIVFLIAWVSWVVGLFKKEVIRLDSDKLRSLADDIERKIKE